MNQDAALNVEALWLVLDLRPQFGLTPSMEADISRYCDEPYYAAAFGQ